MTDLKPLELATQTRRWHARGAPRRWRLDANLY